MKNTTKTPSPQPSSPDTTTSIGYKAHPAHHVHNAYHVHPAHHAHPASIPIVNL